MTQLKQSWHYQSSENVYSFFSILFCSYFPRHMPFLRTTMYNYSVGAKYMTGILSTSFVILTATVSDGNSLYFMSS